MKLHPFRAFLLMGAMTLPMHAQFWDTLFNPEVKVTLTHPPSLGIKAQRVAFAPVNSPVAEDLLSACIADLTNSGQIEVLDRGNIEKVLSEQRFANTGLVDEKTAVELGRLLGSPVLIFVKVLQANVKHIPSFTTKPGWTDKDNKFHPPVTTYTSRTQYDFNASVQAVELATGRIHSQQRIAVAPSRQVSSDQGVPAFPSEAEVRELAVDEARTMVRRMLLSWTEQRTLIFYDDKDYGMKEAYRRLKLNDAAGALQQSRDALAEAKADPKVKPKYLGHASYNVGMCHFILGDYQAALPFLKAARETDAGHRIYANAETECLAAIKLEEEMSRVDARSKVALNAPAAEPTRAPEPARAAPSVEERLEKLDSLRKKGLISPQDYEKKKAEILRDL